MEIGQSASDFAAAFRDRNFDRVIDLHASLRSRVISNKVKCSDKRRIDKSTLRRFLMVWSKKGLDRPLSTLAAYLATVGAPVGDDFPEIRLSEKEQSQVQSIRQEGIPRLGIGWGARHPTKSVPGDLWLEVLRKVSSTSPMSVAIYGMDSDKRSIDEFIAQSSDLLSGVRLQPHLGLPLRTVITSIAACDAFLASDSGLMHVADALHVPTFALFGPTHPALGFVPSGEQSRAFHAGTWCSPCHRHGSAPCFRDRRFCFDDLPTEQIASAVAACLVRAASGVRP